MVSETPYGCNTVGRELWWAILFSLLCPETDWNIRVGKQGYVFILTDFKKWWFDVSFLTSICVNNYFETEKRWIFYNKLTQQTFCLLDLLNSRQSKTNFVFGLVSLNCRLRLFEYFIPIIFYKRHFLPASRTYSMPTRIFCTLSSPSHVKYYLKSQKVPPF